VKSGLNYPSSYEILNNLEEYFENSNKKFVFPKDEYYLDLNLSEIDSELLTADIE
jgi:hypothetical protein